MSVKRGERIAREAYESSLFEDLAAELVSTRAKNAQMEARVIDLEADNMTISALANEILGRLQSQKEQIKVLRKERNIDIKTGLLNMRGLHEAYDKLAAGNRRRRLDKEHADSIMFIDIDRFKGVNDTLGHTGADGLLAVLAELLRGRLRENDIIGRFGGDEFVVILPQTDMENAVRVAEDLRSQSRSKVFDTLGVDASLSIGVGIVDSRLDFGSAMEDANKAMIQAKQSGRDQVVIVNPQPPLT